MGSTRSHPLPPGIFVKMPSPPLARSQPISAWYTEAETIDASSEFDGWTDQELVNEINRLTELLKIRDESKRLRELDSERVQVQATPEDDDEYDSDDSDDVMHDPDVRKMVENGEHICHMFDGECLACEMDEDEDDDEEDYDGEVRVLTEEEVQNDPEMTAHFC